MSLKNSRYYSTKGFLWQLSWSAFIHQYMGKINGLGYAFQRNGVCLAYGCENSSRGWEKSDKRKEDG